MATLVHSRADHAAAHRGAKLHVFDGICTRKIALKSIRAPAAVRGHWKGNPAKTAAISVCRFEPATGATLHTVSLAPAKT